MTEQNDDRYIALVKRDVFGDPLDPSDVEELESDLTLWRDTLTKIYQDTARELGNRKPILGGRIPQHQYKQIMAEYTSFKADSTSFMTKVLEKMRDVKALIREDNISEETTENYAALMRVIIEEVRGLRSDLAKYPSGK